MIIETIEHTFSICKVEDFSQVDPNVQFTFISKTDEENSLVCPTEMVPSNTIERNDGWKAFRVQCTLDLSLIGILSAISKVLAENGIGIFAISTFDTDYILVKEENLQRSIDALSDSGYTVIS